MSVTSVEIQIEEYYRQVQIPEHIVVALQQMLTHQFDSLFTAGKKERQILVSERSKLQIERRSLLHAHHAGAVPLDLLKEEQERISRRLGFLDSRIDAGNIEYEQARAHLEDCLALADDAHAIYMSLDDSLRRIANQAFFERIYIFEENNTHFADALHGEPFNVLFNPAVHAEALAYVDQTQNSSSVESLNIEHMVPPTGVEPATYGTGNRRSIH